MLERMEAAHGIHPEAVRSQLAAILASPDFAGSPRDRDFLKFVVGEEISGRGPRLKAFSIAVELFGRDENFDPEHDPVVRTTAGRVRRALERYYLLAGRKDEVIIEIPKGGYAPIFSLRQPEGVHDVDPGDVREPKSSTALVSKIVICSAVGLLIFALGLLVGSGVLERAAWTSAPGARSPARTMVMPFLVLGEAGPDASVPVQLFAAGLTEEIIAQLSRFPELQVVEAETGSQSQPKLGAAYALEGAVRTSGPAVRVTVRLIETQTNAVLWASAYDERVETGELLEVQHDLSQKIVSAVAQPYGAIFQANQKQSRRAKSSAGFVCTSQYYTYRAIRTAGRHGALRECAEQASKTLPDDSAVWATLTLLYADEERFGYNRKPYAAPPLERAREAAQHALSLDPENTRALQGLMITMAVGGELEQALAIGERAIALNPNDTELSGEFGFRLCMAGQSERGMKLLMRARELNPAHSGSYNASLAFCAYLRGDYAEALAYITRSRPDRHHFFHMIAAITLAQTGQRDAAQKYVTQFRAQRPDLIQNWDAEWEKRMLVAEDRQRVREGAEKAGIIDARLLTSPEPRRDR